MIIRKAWTSNVELSETFQLEADDHLDTDSDRLFYFFFK